MHSVFCCRRGALHSQRGTFWSPYVGLMWTTWVGQKHLAELMVAIEALAIDLVHGAQLPQRVQRDDPGGHHDKLRSIDTHNFCRKTGYASYLNLISGHSTAIQGQQHHRQLQKQ